MWTKETNTEAIFFRHLFILLFFFCSVICYLSVFHPEIPFLHFLASPYLCVASCPISMSVLVCLHNVKASFQIRGYLQHSIMFFFFKMRMLSARPKHTVSAVHKCWFNSFAGPFISEASSCLGEAVFTCCVITS